MELEKLHHVGDGVIVLETKLFVAELISCKKEW